MAPPFAAIKALLVPSEGNIPHMYLDTAGKVTVGIGNLISNAAYACTLSFVNRATSKTATSQEITVDFDAVSKQPRGLAAPKYRQFTALDLPGSAIDLLFQNRVQEFLRLLKVRYPKYDFYPQSAQLALMDMGFNLGVSGLKNTWPKLNQAIDKQDWTSASTNCFRPQVNLVRNAEVKRLFEKAAVEAGPLEKPGRR